MIKKMRLFLIIPLLAVAFILFFLANNEVPDKAKPKIIIAPKKKRFVKEKQWLDRHAPAFLASESERERRLFAKIDELNKKPKTF